MESVNKERKHGARRFKKMERREITGVAVDFLSLKNEIGRGSESGPEKPVPEQRPGDRDTGRSSPKNVVYCRRDNGDKASRTRGVSKGPGF